MLDAIEDGNDERLASSRKEGTPKFIKADVGNRMVYKLVKVGDDGSVLAAIEDDIFQTLVGGSDNGTPSHNQEGCDVIEDDNDEEGSDYIASKEDDLNGRTTTIPIQDLAAERQRLKAQIEVLDCILMKVDFKEKKQLPTKKEVANNVDFCEDNLLSYFNTGDIIPGKYKRQRRPNPKYFDYDAKDDSLMGPPLSSTSKESMLRPLSLQKRPRNAIAISSKVTSTWGSHCNLDRATTVHKAKAIVSQEPFNQMLCKVASTCPILSVVTNEQDTISLDNLSIRELHEAFYSTFGRETSVKDKHWLKRQILDGWMKQHDILIKSNFHQQIQNKFKARLDCVKQAEQPLQITTSLNVGNTKRDGADKTNLYKTNDIEYFSDAFRNRLGSRCFQRRVTTPTVLSRGGTLGILTTGSFNGSCVQSGASTIYREVINNGEIVEGKRQRKPNPRYIEDEAHLSSRFIPIHDSRSFYKEVEGVGLNSTSNYSWRDVGTNGLSNVVRRHGTMRRLNLQNISSKKNSTIQRPKLINSNLKQKVGGRGAKLLKMTHNTIQARQHDAEAAAHKANFQLPLTPNVILNVKPEMNEKAKDQASIPLSIVQFDPLATMQSLIQDGRGENKQLIITVPTSNGGTRRKHHRPWTLREVMTLIKGVAQCGGGKWADIKKLAFSTVGYRTAVDLKDKWRNLLRASRAHLHSAKQGEKKKQFTAAIPSPILARVHELASLPNQIPLETIFASNTSRRRRIVYRK